MKTQLESALEGSITKEMAYVSAKENVELHFIAKGISEGKIVIMTREHKPPLGIGLGLTTKVNANIGTSSYGEILDETEKARIAERFGADTLCEMSMSGDIDKIRKKIFEETSIPITTVPIYQAKVEQVSSMTSKEILKTLEKHVDEGVSAVVLHTITRDMFSSVCKSSRILKMVSKGGSVTASWMIENKSENPFIENFDDVLKILYRKDVVLCLGNAMRSGCVCDEMDKLQRAEAKLNAELAKKANEANVQVIIEGAGGHISIKNIKKYIKYYKKITGERPLFVAGPLPTDIALGYDNISACVGGSIASAAGADYLCYITPSEHLSLPNIDDVREGVISCKIAAHIGDSVKFGLSEKDIKMAYMRKSHKWEEQFKLAIDGGEKAEKYHPERYGACTMCGKYCAIDFIENTVRKLKNKKIKK